MAEKVIKQAAKYITEKSSLFCFTYYSGEIIDSDLN